MSGPGVGSAPVSGAIVVPESRPQMGILVGLLVLAAAAVLVRGEVGAQTTAGRVVIAVIWGLLFALSVGRGIVRMRRPSRLEVTWDSITYVRRSGKVSSLSRQDGDRLTCVKRHRGGRIWTLELAVAGTDDAIVLLGFFSRNAIRRACRARGWRLDGRVSIRRGIPKSDQSQIGTTSQRP